MSDRDGPSEAEIAAAAKTQYVRDGGDGSDDPDGVWETLDPAAIVKATYLADARAVLEAAVAARTEQPPTREELDEHGQALYTRGFVDALRLAKHRVGGALTAPELGDYETRRRWTVRAERAITSLLDSIAEERAGARTAVTAPADAIEALRRLQNAVTRIDFAKPGQLSAEDGWELIHAQDEATEVLEAYDSAVPSVPEAPSAKENKQ